MSGRDNPELARRPAWMREIEHTGDVGVVVEARSRAELFARAATAMGRLMVEEEGIAFAEQRTVETCANGDAELMHDVLATALNLFLADGFIWRDATATEDGERIVVTLTGERFNRARHTLLGEIKAVTYHQLSVSQDADGIWRARIIFDV